MKRLPIILLILSPIAYSLTPVAYGQIDREFWFAAPWLSTFHHESMSAGYGQLCITAYGKKATVRISQPAVPEQGQGYFAPIIRTLQPNESVDIPFNEQGPYRCEAAGTSKAGLHIESDEDISVYFAQVNDNSEIYTLKGRTALGTDFVVPMQCTYPNNSVGSTDAFSSIQIVATEPDTELDVITPVPTRQNLTGDPFRDTLNEGEVLTIRAIDKSVSDHLGGTIIHSNKPIAVNSTDDSVLKDGSYDLIGEQIVPSELAGSEYVAVRHNAATTTYGTAENIVLYAFPNQAINYSINGAAAQTLAGGEHVVIDMTTYSTPSVYISADKDFIVFQTVSANGGEMGGTILPRLECTGSRDVVVKKRFNNQQIDILVPTAAVNDFTINGVATTLNFTTVAQNPNWSSCSFKGNDCFDNNGIVHMHNSSSVFHMAIIDYGGAFGTCTYGYFSGYNQLAMDPSSPKDVYYKGETISLGIADADLFENVVWTFPDGTTHAGAEVAYQTTAITDAGYYYVSGESKDGCPLSQDKYGILLHVVVPEKRETLVCQSAEYPSDQVVLYDTTHLGVNILNNAASVTTACANGKWSTVWTARPQPFVTAGRTYRFTMDYFSSTNSKPNVQVIVGDTTVTVNKILVKNTTKTLSFDYMATHDGNITVCVNGGNATNSPKLTLENLSFCPVLPVKDTLVIRTKNCETPDPPTPPDPPVPPTPTYPLEVQMITSAVAICDGEDETTLMYQVTKGTPHLLQVTMNGKTWTENIDSLSTALILSTHELLPNHYDVALVFTDTVHHVSTSALTARVSVNYDPTRVFAQKWNNVLSIYSPSYSGYPTCTWDSYQWYRNGQPVEGENFSRYRIADGVFNEKDYYQVLLRRQQDGVEMLTCPYYPVIKNQ